MSFDTSFPLVTLKEVAKFINGDRSTNYPKGADYVPHGIPFISAADLSDEGVDQHKVKRITAAAYERLRSGKVQHKDILFCLRGSIGKMAFVKPNEIGAIASSLVIVRAQPQIDSRYLNFLLCSQAGQQAAMSLNNGSAQPNVSVSQLQQIRVPLPTLKEQKKIATLLGALDDRITLLRETNATFEAIAQALFKSWFVDFDPVRAKMEGRAPEGMDEATTALFPDALEESELGWVPRGWRVGAVEDFAERVGMGPFGSNIKVETFVPSGVPVISGQHLKRLLVEDNTFNFITPEHANRLVKSSVQTGDVIFTHAGSIGQVSLLHKDAAFPSYVLSQRQFFLRCNSALMSPEWIAHYFKSPVGQHQLLANTSQVGVPSIARPVSYLRSIRLVTPPPELSRKFGGVSGAMNDCVMANRSQLTTLSTLRDTLLPRLISGQLRLPEAQAATEAALVGALQE